MSPRIVITAGFAGRSSPGVQLRKKMHDVDPELLRLKEIERVAHERFLRLSQSAGLSGYDSIVKAAEDLWTEAVSAVRAYQEREDG